jgi:TRAP-type uncharacterized transport system fused permease subunit
VAVREVHCYRYDHGDRVYTYHGGLLTNITAFLGLAGLAGGVENWFLKKTTLYERVMLIVGGLLLVYPIALYDIVGFGLMLLVIVLQKLRSDES